MDEPKILGEKEGVLAIDKPAGLIVHSDGRTKEPSLAAWLVEHLPSQAGVGEPWVSPQGEQIDVCGIVHRLDRTTSGIILAAKDDDTFEYLRNEFRERRMQKEYLAYVYGHPEQESGTIVAEIMRSKESPRRWYARATDMSDKRAAITKWRVRERMEDPETGEPLSLLELHPQTGRTHQIRVHLASIGHPILSDHLYAPGRPQLLGFTRPALHAKRISLTLPAGVHTSFTSKLHFVRT